MAGQISAQFALFSVCLIPPTVMSAYYYNYGQTDEELEKILNDKYGRQIERNRTQAKEMSRVISAAIHPKNNDPEMRKVFDNALKAGKHGNNRSYKIGEKVEIEEEEEQQFSSIDNGEKKQTKGKKRKKRKKKIGSVLPNKEIISKDDILAKHTETTPLCTDKKYNNFETFVTLSSVATVAAIAGFLLGGSNTSRR